MEQPRNEESLKTSQTFFMWISHRLKGRERGVDLEGIRREGCHYLSLLLSSRFPFEHPNYLLNTAGIHSVLINYCHYLSLLLSSRFPLLLFLLFVLLYESPFHPTIKREHPPSREERKGEMTVTPRKQEQSVHCPSVHGPFPLGGLGRTEA